MSSKCPDCNLANFPSAKSCSRCGTELAPVFSPPSRSFAAKFVRRAGVLITVCLIGLAGFYVSLVGSAARLSLDQKQTVNSAVGQLKVKGFSTEAFLMERLAAFRQSDNWLN